MPRRVVVIVLTYNSAAFIRPCLDALAAHTPLPHKVVVVDNASADGTLDIVKSEHPRVDTVQTGSNLGVSKGNNLALARYDADAYVLLNPDTQVRAGWLEALLAEVDADPRVGIVGGKLLYPDGRIQHAGGEAAPFGPRHIGVLEPASAHDAPADRDFVTYACALITRAVIDRIGYLDEGYSPFYYEDADHCFRARAAGFRVRYAPRCVVTHHEGVATGRAMTKAKARILERNRLRFNALHGRVAPLAEAKTLVGHTARGRGAAIAGAWTDVLKERRRLKARRAHLADFLPSVFSPPDRHAPTLPV